MHTTCCIALGLVRHQTELAKHCCRHRSRQQELDEVHVTDTENDPQQSAYMLVTVHTEYYMGDMQWAYPASCGHVCID